MQYSLNKMLGDEKPIFEWIIEHSKDGVLTKSLPDNDNAHLAALKGMRFVDGMLDGILGEQYPEHAQELFNLFVEFTQKSTQSSPEIIEPMLGEIYHFLMMHRTLSFIDDFLKLLVDNQHLYVGIAGKTLKFAEFLLHKSPHREVVKFAITIVGIFPEEEIISDLLIFGLSDEFALFVAIALIHQKQSSKIFELVKKVKGWGRIAYIKHLEIENIQIREWLLCDGYNCEIGIDHVVLKIFEKTKPLEYIEEYGFNDSVFRGIGEMLESFCYGGKVSFEDYIFSKELTTRYILEAKERYTDKQIPKRDFSILCALSDYVRNFLSDEPVFDENEEKELIGIILYFAYECGINWEEIALNEPFNYDSKQIAKKIGVDLWNKQFEIAQKEENFDNWDTLSNTNNAERLEKLCALVEEKIDLEKRKGKPTVSEDLDSLIGKNKDLEFIANKLTQCNKVFGVNLIKTLLQSPTRYSRKVACNVLESWSKKDLFIPLCFLDLAETVIKDEVDKELKQEFKKLYSRLKAKQEQNFKKSEYIWFLQVWEEFYSTGIWSIWDKEKQKREFPNISYELLDLPQDLVCKFKQWQTLYDENGLYWHKDNADKSLKKLYAVSNEQRIELARALKLHFKNKAYVETHIDGELKEIHYFRVAADYSSTLENEDGTTLNLEDFNKDHEMYQICDNDAIRTIDKELQIWAKEYFDEECKYFHEECGIFNKENFIKLQLQGKYLAYKLQALMPKNVIIEYFELPLQR